MDYLKLAALCDALAADLEHAANSARELYYSDTVPTREGVDAMVKRARTIDALAEQLRDAVCNLSDLAIDEADELENDGLCGSRCNCENCRQR